MFGTNEHSRLKIVDKHLTFSHETLRKNGLGRQNGLFLPATKGRKFIFFFFFNDLYFGIWE